LAATFMGTPVVVVEEEMGIPLDQSRGSANFSY
jgi:hypothetical protein